MNDTRTLQLRLLEILLALQEVCRQHNLRYYIVDGTTLGAVRHQGFIPWDDDVDVCMPRKDYELLIEHADEWLPKRYEMICYERDHNYPFHFGKIQDSETTLVERAYRYYLGGIYIDIFMIDGAPKGRIAQWLYEKRGRRLCKLMYFLSRDPYRHGHGPSCLFPLLIHKCFNMDKLQAKMKRHMTRYDYDSCAVSAINKNSGEVSFVSREGMLGEPVPILFEGHMVNGFKDNAAFLESMYGNYMQLPPEEQRRTHKFYYLDLNLPYRQYKPKDAKRYLLFASLSYAYSIMRPIQEEILKRGDEVAWFLEDSCPDMLLPGERRIKKIEEAIAWNPFAVIAPGNWVYPFLPGIKVEVFHGYPNRKRIEKVDDHFTIRGWWDIYCTQGESSTPYFKELEKKHKYFKVYETGWAKADTTFRTLGQTATTIQHTPPTILYAPTFSKGISSAWVMIDAIEKMATEKNWQWIITFHPKLLEDKQLVADYETMAGRHPNVDFRRINKGLETFMESDVLLCDSSSLIVEYLMTGKPTVTYRNTHPGPYLIDVQQLDEIPAAIENALTHPADLMKAIDEYTRFHEGHRDGNNSARVLDAIDDYAANYQGRLKKKPLNLVRNIKLRRKIHYFK